MAEPLSEIDEVRNKTTEDEDWVSDDLISQYLIKYQHRKRNVRILLAAAEVCEFMMRDEIWDSKTLGSHTASSLKLPDRVKEYRRQASNLQPVLL